MARGRLITLEGIDGAGKTTLAHGLREALERRGLPIALLREPGGVPISERIREIVKDPGGPLAERAEALLFAAARAQLVQERIVPLLDAGTIVVLDRFVDSSLVYQGVGRFVGIDQVAAINAFATGGLRPDRTLLLSIAPAVARARAQDRPGVPDVLDRESDDFFARIAAAYARLAETEPRRVRAIDADAPSAEVLTRALEAIADLVE